MIQHTRTYNSWFVSSTAQIKQRQQIEIKMETIQLLEVQQNSELLYILAGNPALCAGNSGKKKG